jgi:glycosyltransferase involved in cell wall biosynthesis
MTHYKNVALVTDSITQFGGGDRVLESLMKVFPKATIFTSFFKPAAYPASYQNYKVVTFLSTKSLFTKLLARFSRSLSFTYPYFFEKFNFDNYDLVISFTAGPAKGIITKSTTRHVSIIFTPPHYQFGKHRNLRGMAGEKLINNLITPVTDQILRIWDYNAGQRPDELITISKYIKNIVKDIYHRDSFLIYPPVNTNKIKNIPVKASKNKFFLIISRLFEFKRIDRAVEACTKLGINLKIIGSGPDKNYLQSIAGPSIEFLGELDDTEAHTYLSKCTALIFAGTDDFGIVPIEAMAAGKPVIAYHTGGALETILPGKTGEFFQDENEETSLPTLAKILDNFDAKKYNPRVCIEQAEKFSEERFIKNIKKYFRKDA